MDISNTEEKFLAAVEIVKNLPKSGPVKPTNDTKLKFYSYYKQATEGPCELPKPGFWDIVNRAKWDAWSKLENMSKEEAMKKYVDEFVEIMKETIPQDPESVNEFYDLMGPYLNLVPEEVKAKHDYRVPNNTVKSRKPIKGYKDDNQNDTTEEGFFAPIFNGHNMNGNGNESDSDEFSDTREQVNENSETEENHVEHLISLEESGENIPVSSIKGPMVNVRGGGDTKLSPTDTSSPAASYSGSRGNRTPRQARSPDNPLQYLAGSNNNIGGSGGSRRSGGNAQYDIAVDANEQLALAVIRLQHIMEQVVVRLDTLETLLKQRQAVTKEIEKKKSFWAIGGSTKAAIFFIAWPVIVQALIYFYRRRNRLVKKIAL